MTAKVFQATQVGIRKNLLINGDMVLAQRLGAPVVGVGAVHWTYQAQDRWKTLQKAGTPWTLFTHNSRPAGGSLYSLWFSAVTANATKGGVIQIIENRNACVAQGRRVSLQLQVHASANVGDVRVAVLSWTGSADAPTDPISAWNGSGLNPTLAANWGYLNTPANIISINDTWYQVKVESILVPTNANNLAVMIWCEDETQTINSYWIVTDVQLEIGTKCTPFERLPFHEMLFLAQRYYYKSVYPGLAPSGAGNGYYMQPAETPALTGARIRQSFPFPTPMRTTPTLRHWDNAGNLSRISTITTDTITNNIVPGATLLTGFPHYAMVTGVNGPMLFNFDASAEL